MSAPVTPSPSVPMLKIGSSGRVTPRMFSRPPWKRMRLVTGSWITRAATIFQLGFLGQPVSVSHRAGRIDRPLEDGLAVGPGGALGGDAAAAFEHDEQIFDRAVAQRIGEGHAVADQPVAFGRHDDDIALGADLAGLASPGHVVGGEEIAVAVHAHAAGGGDDLGLAVIADAVGAELDALLVRRRAAAGAAGGASCAAAAAGSTSIRGSAVQQNPMARTLGNTPT